MKHYQIGMIPGDTVGPELARQAEKVLNFYSGKNNIKFELHHLNACGPAIEKFGTPLPDKDLNTAKKCVALLFGNIGDRRYQHLPFPSRPEYAFMELRKQMSVCTNIRPIFMPQSCRDLSPLKPEFLQNGFDMVVVRDIQGGMLAGKRKAGCNETGRIASDLEYYDEIMIEITARHAFEIAATRKKKVDSLDKASVLASSTLWRKKVTETACDYPGIQLKHHYIDNAAMEVIITPGDFDVILTNNVFGDIIADELTQLSGAPALFGSAELAQNGRGIYTPNQLHHPHGEIAGKNIVSPIGILNALAMLLTHSCNEPEVAGQLASAIEAVFHNRLTTPELPIDGFEKISTDELGDEVICHLAKHAK